MPPSAILRMGDAVEEDGLWILIGYSEMRKILTRCSIIFTKIETLRNL